MREPACKLDEMTSIEISLAREEIWVATRACSYRWISLVAVLGYARTVGKNEMTIMETPLAREEIWVATRIWSYRWILASSEIWDDKLIGVHVIS
jgi:hypothetical protein